MPLTEFYFEPGDTPDIENVRRAGARHRRRWADPPHRHRPGRGGARGARGHDPPQRPQAGARGGHQPRPQPPPALQDDRVLHYGQYVAVVVAGTAERATAAARLVEVGYELAEPVLDLDDPRAEVLADPRGLDQRGDVAAGLAAAAVRVEATYMTPDETNNPLGLFATVAFWDGDSLTVHDATQWPDNTRAALAGAFGIPEGNVRVLAPMASLSYAWYWVPCQARASIGRDGTAFVRSAATDIGTGAYTVMTQLSAELLGLDLGQVRPGRHRRRHRQRGLPRHRPAHPLPAHHHRPAPVKGAE